MLFREMQLSKQSFGSENIVPLVSIMCTLDGVMKIKVSPFVFPVFRLITVLFFVQTSHAQSKEIQFELLQGK